MSNKLDPAATAADTALLHRLAAEAGGKLILASFGEDPATGEKLRPRVESFAVGNDADMAARIIALATERHRNVYIAFTTMRADLPQGLKGGEADIEQVIGLVADFDAREDPEASRWAERLPLPPTMVLATSSIPEVSFQCRFLFDRPISLAEAKRLARALQAAAGCDTCTADVSHVWRLAGTLNWPNRQKVEKHGRPSAPQLVSIVLPFEESRLVSPDALAAALSVSAPTPAEKQVDDYSVALSPAARVALADLDQWNVPAELKVIVELGRDPERPKRQDNSRSAWLFHAVRGLHRLGVPPEIILSIITDPDFKIADSVRDKGRRALDYARRQIARAVAEASDSVLEAFNNEHAVVENYGNRTIVVSFDPKGAISHRSFEDFRKSYDHRKIQASRGGK